MDHRILQRHDRTKLAVVPRVCARETEKTRPPIIFIIFNRPYTTSEVFEKMGSQWPKALGDRGRARANRPGEAEKHIATRETIEDLHGRETAADQQLRIPYGRALLERMCALIANPVRTYRCRDRVYGKGAEHPAAVGGVVAPDETSVLTVKVSSTLVAPMSEVRATISALVAARRIN
jgi:hypothetical protein